MDIKERLKEIEEQVSVIKDPVHRKIAFEKLMDSILDITKEKSISKKKSKTKTGGKKKKTKSQKSLRLTIVKDINLMPKGKKSFADFIVSKKPEDNQQKCAVTVYYLKHELGLSVSINHVFTCYKGAGWRVPNLENVLRIAAFRKGWFDTSDMKDIKLTTHGENLVEHDLPVKSKNSKK